MELPPYVYRDVPLAPLTTFEVGGPARFFREVDERDELSDLLAWARTHDLPTLVIGGGSNLLVGDDGFAGLAIRFAEQPIKWGVRVGVRDGELRVEADAGVLWDDLVATCVARGGAGVECLSGIPGRVGAAPIQNIGAYGQELATTLRAVRVIERATGEERQLEPRACGFAYRHSRFKAEWRDRFIIRGIELGLRLGAPEQPRHDELRRRLGLTQPPPAVSDVREQVLEIRRAKSMLYDPADPNHRSAGSFFLNPLVPTAQADAIARRADADSGAALPRYPDPSGAVKIPAAWLIERAGFERGHVEGAVGLSSQHALAIVNRGGAKSAEIVAFAEKIRDRVEAAFGVRLRPEPVLVGIRSVLSDP